MYRELQVHFLENGNVRYRFCRRGFPHRISTYSIDYPTDKIILHEGENVHTADFRQSARTTNQLVLEWDKTPETQWTKDQRVIDYEKVGFLNIISPGPLSLAYRERLSIKASEDSCFHLFLHGRDRRISALKAQSQAIFLSASRGYIHCCNAFVYSGRYVCWEESFGASVKVHLRPTQLADAKFHASGILQVEWVLEIDESKSAADAALWRG